MKNLLLSILLVIGVASLAQAQLAPGASVTNFLATAGTNWSTVAVSQPNLINRLINNTNATSALLCSYTLPVVSGSTQYNTFIRSNIYNSVVMGLQTNIPNNVVVVSTAAATLPFASFAVPASSSTNITIGAELFGTYTNSAGTSTTTNYVFTSDVYNQR